MKAIHKEYTNPVKHREYGDNKTSKMKIHISFQRHASRMEEGG